MYKAADAAFGGVCPQGSKKADRLLKKPLYGRVFTIKAHSDDAGSAYIPAALGKTKKVCTLHRVASLPSGEVTVFFDYRD